MVRPSFFFNAPERKPLVVCGAQDVAATISSMVGKRDADPLLPFLT
jgi:hypothetical protein